MNEKSVSIYQLLSADCDSAQKECCGCQSEAVCLSGVCVCLLCDKVSF